MMLRISLVSNELPPYRIPFFEALDRMPGVSLQALFCTRREPNRHWETPTLHFGHEFLKERIITIKGRYIHNNPGVIAALHKFAPSVIITGGFNPTHLYAFAFAVARGIPHIAMTDGTDRSEKGLGRWHKAVRRMVYARSSAFIAASKGGTRLHHGYGVADDACFRSCLCVNNELFAPSAQTRRDVDFLFCGRIEAVKNPLFAFDVALATARKLGRRTSIMFVGAGPQEGELRELAAHHAAMVDASFHGFMSHDELPRIYQAARIFLFPTTWDPWGVVANEACAAGLPVLVTPEAGVAGELVLNGHNGHVEALDVESWSANAARLLTQTDDWERLSRNSMAMASEYTYANAAKGVVDASLHAIAQRHPGTARVHGGYRGK
ncbi:glycosyltransferase family 4 protein [Noviherbaspirillum aerium]|uniref:glycosyltransferase family 4 protein n=1 Tax=Noviherbaspirillum aerium TaxID=2588497 RepID=UPI001CEF5A92|nr:glycosyltransferase family 4 protein [Noviherbaspirillum aerium]